MLVTFDADFGDLIGKADVMEFEVDGTPDPATASRLFNEARVD